MILRRLNHTQADYEYSFSGAVLIFLYFPTNFMYMGLLLMYTVLLNVAMHRSNQNIDFMPI